ncbi:hypothetical protein, conserved [Eimeria praecox]|uniref:Uncharacterized protein n=1 Tax=Eimeria praecox TaxID=51316 RepID=U6G6B8_9EIME|nr:hypothetical protein, conserved [Eimeria praecox]
MPCAECCPAAGVLYSPDAEQAQQRELVASSAENVLRKLQQPSEVTFRPLGKKKSERQLQQQQRQKHQLGQSDQQKEQWTRIQQQLNNTWRGRLHTQLCSSSDDCTKIYECGNSQRGSRCRQCTSSCINDMNNGNWRRSGSSSSGSITGCEVHKGKNEAEPPGLTGLACPNTGAGATTPEAQAAESALEAQRNVTLAPLANELHARALELLRKLSPFPEGRGFMPSVLNQLHHKQLHPSEVAGSSYGAAVDIDVAEASAIAAGDLGKHQQTAPRVVHLERKGVQQKHQQQKLELEPSHWQVFSDDTTATVPPQQDSDVLLPERLENLLLKEPPIQQQPPSVQLQTVHGLQRDQQYAAETQQVQRRNGFRRQRNESCQSPIEEGNGSSSKNSTSSNSLNRNGSSDTGGCIRAPEICPLCSIPCNCDNTSRSKRRPGNSSCWQQTAALLRSLITKEDRPEPLQQHEGHSAAPDAKHALKGVASPSGSKAPGATPRKACPRDSDWMSAAAPATIRLHQQHAEPHLHQSIPADVAQQILRRITCATVELHRHEEQAQHRYNQRQTSEVQQEQKGLQQDLQQDLQQEHQDVHQAHGKGSGRGAICCCRVSSCRSFCAFLLHLLGDVRTHEKQHARLHLLLLQLLLRLLQQQLACAICRCDAGFVGDYRAFVAEQVGQLLHQQQKGKDKGLTPGSVLLDTNSLHEQKRMVVLLQLALLLRAWRGGSCSGGSRGVVKGAYLCLLHSDVCLELREAAADILAAAALDDLSIVVQQAARDAANKGAGWAMAAEVPAAVPDTALTAAIDATTAGAPEARGTCREVDAVALCSSITKAAVEGSSSAAAAATELTASVACGLLLMLQHTGHPFAAAEAPTSGSTGRPCIREFSVEVAPPAFPLLLLLLLPGLEQQFLKGETLQDTAATPLSLSLHAAEALHLLRIAVFHMQQPQAWRQQCQLQIMHSQRQRRIPTVLTQQQQVLLRLLEQQLVRLLRAAIQTCDQRVDLLLPLLPREWPGAREASRNIGNTVTSWSIMEAAAAGVEAPLCCVCVLVQLPRLALAAEAATSSDSETDTLEKVITSLVNQLLRLVAPRGCDTPAPALDAREIAAAPTGSPPGGAPAAATAAAFGCFSKLLVALTEAAKSACMQIQQSANAPAAPGPPEGSAVEARALQQCFARGAAAVVRFCLQSAEAGYSLQQKEQVADLIAAAVDADIALLRFLSSRAEQQLPEPLACQLLQQILQSPISHRRAGSSRRYGHNRGGSNCSSDSCSAYCSKRMTFTGNGAVCLEASALFSSETTCNKGGEEPTTALCCGAVVPLAWVAVESSVAVALQALARFLEWHKTAAASATPRYEAAAASSDAGSADAGAAGTAATAARLLRIAWTHIVGPALRDICVSVSAPVAAASGAPLAKQAGRTGAAATATAAKTAEAAAAACVQTGEQHALSIIGTRGSLISSFSSAVTAAAAAAITITATTAAGGEQKMPRPVQHELMQLQDLQEDFAMVLQHATLAAAYVVLSHELPGSSLQRNCASSYWNSAHLQDPVEVLQQLLRALLVHCAATPTTMHFLRSSSSCGTCNRDSCLWRAMLQVAVTVASLRPLALQLFLWPLRCLLSQQQEDPQQQWKQQPQRHLVEIWHVLYACFSMDETAAAGAAPNSTNSSSSKRCWCCGIVKLEDFLQQDDWVQVSDLLLELLQLLQQTSISASDAAATAEISCLQAATAAVQRAAAAERAYRSPPETQGDCQPIFFPSKGFGPCSSSEHPDCIDE